MSDLTDMIKGKPTSTGIITAAEKLQEIMRPSGLHVMPGKAAIDLGNLLVLIAKKQQDLDTRLEKLERTIKG